MTNPLNSRPESSGLYIIQERESTKDLEHLYHHDEMITASMGGVLSEQSLSIEVERVLDVGCGTGSWLIGVARTYPTVSKLVGIDKDKRAIEYATLQAKTQGLDHRIKFREMDAQRVLELPARSFDLANQRLGGTYMRTWDWPLFLSELRRVTRPGGIIRIVEADMVESNSSTLNYFDDLLLRALHQSGHFFELKRDGMVPGVKQQMQRSGIQNIQTCSHVQSNHAGTPEAEDYLQGMEYIFQAFQPFFRKWISPGDEFETLKRRAQEEMRQPNFTSSWKLTTMWGINPK